MLEADDDDDEEENARGKSESAAPLPIPLPEPVSVESSQSENDKGDDEPPAKTSPQRRRSDEMIEVEDDEFGDNAVRRLSSDSSRRGSSFKMDLASVVESDDDGDDLEKVQEGEEEDTPLPVEEDINQSSQALTSTAGDTQKDETPSAVEQSNETEDKSTVPQTRIKPPESATYLGVWCFDWLEMKPPPPPPFPLLVRPDVKLSAPPRITRLSLLAGASGERVPLAVQW